MQNTKKKEQKIQSKEESIEVILPNWTMIDPVFLVDVRRGQLRLCPFHDEVN